MAERKTLQRMTAELGKRHGMVFRLDALCDHIDAEGLADLDNRFDDTALLGGGIHLAYQLPIDLQPSRAQPHETDQRRVARAEIIDLDFDTHLLDAVNRLQKLVVAVVQKDRLDQFENQGATRYLECLQIINQLRIVEALPRNVDRDPWQGCAVLLPCHTVGEHASQDRSIDLRRQAELIGDLQEYARREGAALAVMPARQGLDANDVAGVGI